MERGDTKESGRPTDEKIPRQPNKRVTVTLLCAGLVEIVLLWGIYWPKLIEEDALPWCIHLAESPAEWELFTKGTGPLSRFETWASLSALPRPLRLIAAPLARRGKPLLSRLGCRYAFAGAVSPTAYAERVGALASRSPHAWPRPERPWWLPT